MTRLPHVPALDGLRGLAVAAVLLFHAGVPFAVGGHLGVTVFFALSGFLITSLLLAERDRTGSVDLKAFWGRRAKRLVPALLLTLGLVAAVAAWTAQPADSTLPDSIATLTWSTNWWFLYEGNSYADLFSDPSPLQHAWSLAVEEQYYLVFPLLLLLLVRGGRRALAVGVALMTLASVIVGVLLVDHGASSARLHYGTDTRVAEILVGALLAVVLQRGAGWRQIPTRALGVGGALAAGALVLVVVTAEDDSRWLHRGGWAMVALATCAVLATAVQQGSVTGRVLAVPPLVWLGQVSYGAYLFHWPLFLLLDERSTGLTGPLLLLVRLTAVLMLADLSLRIVELPVRSMRISRAAGASSWGVAAGAGVLVVALATGAVALPSWPSAPPLPPGAMAGPAPAVAPRQAPQRMVPQQVGPRQRQVVVPPAAPAPRRAATRPPARQSAALPPAFTADPSKATVPPVPPSTPAQLRVAVVGDSLANNLGSGLRAWAQGRSDVVVYNLSLPGCPLSRGGERRYSSDRVFAVKSVCGWWDDSSSKRRQAFDTFAPELVVDEDGINELFDRRLPEWSDWRAPGDLTFDNWLVDEYDRFVRSVGETKVLTLNTPCADWDRYSVFAGVDNIEVRVAAVNTDQQRITGMTRGDLKARICPNGQYSDTVEGVPNGRPDGLHLSSEAALALARNWLGPLVLKTGQGSKGLLGG